MTTTTLAYFPSPPRGVWHLGTLSALVIIAGIVAALYCVSWLRDEKRRDRGGVYTVAAWVAPVVVFGMALLLAYFLGGVPRLLGIGPLPIRAYALLILAGVVVALYIGERRWTERGGEPGMVLDVALWAVIFGFLGARLYHVLTDWTTYFGPGGAGLWGAISIWDGGLGIWGAVALGGVGAWIGCRWRGIPLPAFGDAIAPGIVLAQAIGRIGNYFNQELYGRSTKLPWGLEIFERRDAAGGLNPLNGVSTGQLIEVVHPTFLYELLWNLLVFALLIWVDRRFRIGHGRLFALYVAAYCFGRFWIELMRSDMATHIAGIRINSFVSVFVFIGAVVYIMVAPKGREDPSALRGDDADEESPVEEVAKELAAVAATTGVVAAAKAAGEMEDEDAAEADAAEEAEAGEPEVAEEPETAGEPEVEAVAEAGEQADSVGGVGAVEGDEVVEAEEAASEVHEGAEEAEEAADEIAEEAAEAADEIAEEDTDEPGDEESASKESGEAGEEQSASDNTDEPADEEAVSKESGEDAKVVAEEGSDEPPESESASEDSGEAAEADAEQPAEESASEEPGEAVGGVGAVEGDEVVEAEEAAPEVHEAVAEGAGVADEAAEEQTEKAKEPAGESEPAQTKEPEEVAESGNGLRGWIRSRRNR